MIKRSSGLFKIFFITFAIVLAVFIALVTMTNLLDIISVQKCLIGYILFSSLTPFVVESFIYFIGKITKKIHTESRDFEIDFEPVSDTSPCFINIENGIEKCVFFAGEGKILTGDKKDIHFIYDSENNKIIVHNMQGLCKGIFKSIYSYTVSVVTYDVYTTLTFEDGLE